MIALSFELGGQVIATYLVSHTPEMARFLPERARAILQDMRNQHANGSLPLDEIDQLI